MKTAFLVNDCQVFHFGSAAVTRTIEEQLLKRDILIIGRSTSAEHWSKKAQSMKMADLVIVNGEGSIHSNRRAELLTVANHFPSVLINFSIDKYEKIPDSIRNFRIISTRESASHTYFFNRTGFISFLIPDLSLGQLEWFRSRDRAPVKDVGLFDSVKQQDWIQPRQYKPKEVEAFLSEASSFSRWVTGRFHGILLAAMWNRPFSAYESNTHKNLGLMEDMGIPHLYHYDRNQAKALLPETVSESVQLYVESAQKKIDLLFNRIARDI